MEIKTVFSSMSVNEVNFVKSLLESYDIKAEVFDETIAQIAPHYLFGQGGPRVYVLEEDFEKASEIIRDYYKKEDI